MSTYLVPSGPVVFDGEPETSTTGIRLSWLRIEKSFWNGQEITYKIILMKNRRKVKLFTTTDLKVIFAGLKPKTTYTVILSGKTKLGEIPPSAKEATTKPSTFLLIHTSIHSLSFFIRSFSIHPFYQFIDLSIQLSNFSIIPRELLSSIIQTSIFSYVPRRIYPTIK